MKVGDWVNLVRDDGIIFDTFQYDNDWNGKNGFSLELWQPKEGEWCWFRSSHMPKYIQVLAQFKEFSYDSFAGKYTIMFNKEDVEEGVTSLHYDKCEPFIGELPSFIKDKQ